MNKPPIVKFSGDPDERNYKSDKFALGSLTTITICSDYLCPWCWVGFFHAQRLTQEFGVTFDWRGFELIPPSMEHNPGSPKPVDPNAAPKPPSRFDLFAESENIAVPMPRPPFTRTHNALLGAEFALLEGDVAAFDTYNEGVYRAFWERSEDIADVAVLTAIAQTAGLDTAVFAESIASGKYENHVVPYDDTAYAVGIRHVPTFFFNAEEKLAEAPYADLARATERFLIRAEKFKGKS